MRVRVISDLHGAVEHLPRAAAGCDALVVLGDLINVLDYRSMDGILVEVFGREPVAEAAALRSRGRFAEARAAFRRRVGDERAARQRFLELARQQYERVLEALPEGAVVTFGNVDIPDLLRSLVPPDIRLVDGEVVELGAWRWGIVGGGMRTPLGIPGEVTEEEHEARLGALGPVDVVGTHAPPRIPWFCYDTVARKFEPGSTPLIAYVQEHQPRYALFGHVHQPLLSRGAIGRTELVNVGHFQAGAPGFDLEVPD